MPDDGTRAQNADDRWTVQRVLDWTISHLKQHGSESPRLDAEILLARARTCPRVRLYTEFNVEMTPAERGTMRDLVKRRANHEPVAYLVGHREFFSLDFDVTPDVLIPRPETETLVLELIDAAREMPAPKILDVGTGSGCIAIAAAVNLPNATVTAIDLSEPALEVARGNAKKHAVSDRIEFWHGDLFAPLAEGRRFDFIISNPPYVTEAEFETLSEDVRGHEPRSALVGGEDGLDVVRRLIADSPAQLSPGGRLWIEIDPGQSEAVCELMTADGRYKSVDVIRDLNREVRGVAGVAGG